MKTIRFLSQSTPEKPALGYGDIVTVLDGEKNLYNGIASCCPNPYKLSDHGSPVPWQHLYAMLAPQTLQGVCIDHTHFGKCILLNNGEKCITLNPNKNHNGEYYAKEVFIHPGGLNSTNSNWRGSRACLTIPQIEYSKFISHFSIGEKCIVQISKKEAL